MLTDKFHNIFIRKDSQIDFAEGYVFLEPPFGGGGVEVLHFVRDLLFPILKNSKSAEVFSSREITGKNLVSKEEYYRQHNFE